MPFQIAVTHRATFRLDQDWRPPLLRFRLSPRPCIPPVRSAAVVIHPSPSHQRPIEDGNGNVVTLVHFSRKITELNVAVDLLLEGDPVTTWIPPFSGLSNEEALFAPGPDENAPADLLPFLGFKTVRREIQESILGFSAPLANARPEEPDFPLDCAALVRRALHPIHPINVSLRDPAAVLSKGMASAAESANLLLLLLRRFALPARFVSGYRLHLISEQAGSADSAELSSWVEVYHPNLGWLGLDPVAAAWIGPGVIPLAVAAHPEDAANFPAALLNPDAAFSEFLTVQRLHEPESTPYDPSEMKRNLDEVIQEAERRLRRAGLRLHMASTLRFSAPGWDGRESSDLFQHPAEELLHCFRERAGPGALPITLLNGEPSRWALVFREDGEPIWKDDRILLDAGGKPPSSPTPDLAKRLMESIASKLKIDPTFILDGFEDPLWHMMFEGDLPPELDTDLPDVREGRERRRLMALLDGGLQNPAGFVLPLNFDVYSNRWNSCPWKFRRGRLFLLPGTDPMGIRLPLRSISDHFARAPFPDPFYRKTPLSEAAKHLYKQEMVYTPVHQAHPIETALCVQLRGGQLHVFLPAIDRTEAWIELVSIVERCATKLDLPVALEGIRVPLDHRLRLMQIRPLPEKETFEIKLPFFGGPDETAAKMEVLMDSLIKPGVGPLAHCLSLGNAVPAESPFFARPDLLSRFIRFWRSHPALALLLSAPDGGPVADAFLPFEAGGLLSEELELGLLKLEAGGLAPWEVDRALRTALDSSGQWVSWLSAASLFDPETYEGRKGAVELRSLVCPLSYLDWRLQTGILLAILAILTDNAEITAAPSREDLYDRALLPYFVMHDIQEVFSILRVHGFSIDMAALQPLFLRRFPVRGRSTCDDILIEVRAAAEPTLLRSESKTERLQILLEGWNPERYRLTCNDASVPLSRTGRAGEYVGAVRYSVVPRAPEIPFVLQFDIYDPWNHRSAGGFRFFPENNRFEANVHSPGRLYEPILLPNHSHPLTVDLRFLRT